MAPTDKCYANALQIGAWQIDYRLHVSVTIISYLGLDHSKIQRAVMQFAHPRVKTFFFANEMKEKRD